jgi:hypothetical protein
MPTRFIGGLIVVLFFPALHVKAKCVAGRLEVHGSITGKLSPDAKLAVSLVFRNARKHPETETSTLEGSTFAETVGFSMQSRTGFLVEWGEKCDRVPKQVVVRLIDKDSREIDRVTMNVRGDFLNTANGFILRSPVVLHGNA